MPIRGTIKNYLRTTDFRTAEVSIHWSDADGEYIPRLFVSRTHNVIVLSIASPTDSPVQCTFHALPIEEEKVQSDRSVDGQWITYHNVYVHGKGGYDVAVCVVPKGGKLQSGGEKIRVVQADRVLALMAIQPYTAVKDSSIAELKKEHSGCTIRRPSGPEFPSGGHSTLSPPHISARET